MAKLSTSGFTAMSLITDTGGDTPHPARETPADPAPSQP